MAGVKKRERKPSFGVMAQLDGPHHDWFEGRGPKCVLMVMVDDATNRMRARFFAQETTRVRLKELWREDLPVGSNDTNVKIAGISF